MPHGIPSRLQEVTICASAPLPGRPHQLDYVCFMFWDIAPIVPGREDTVREVLKVLEATLALDSVACQRPPCTG
jgi:hypothetical protein